jgi:hypothetical protein
VLFASRKKVGASSSLFIFFVLHEHVSTTAKTPSHLNSCARRTFDFVRESPTRCAMQSPTIFPFKLTCYLLNCNKVFVWKTRLKRAKIGTRF